MDQWAELLQVADRWAGLPQEPRHRAASANLVEHGRVLPARRGKVVDPAPEARSIGSLFSDLARETSALVRTEIQLAKTEIIDRINRFSSGLVMVIAGGLLLYAALLVLLFAAAIGLGQVFDWGVTKPWLSFLIVGVVVDVIGVGLLLKGKGDMKPANLMPRRTVDSLKEDATWIRQKVR